ncbi:MAG: TspO/MBR family protein, partial [Rhabdochlamydiaceae bacterium]
ACKTNNLPLNDLKKLKMSLHGSGRCNPRILPLQNGQLLFAVKNKLALQLFFVQLGLNFLWSVVFFGLHSPFVAFTVILLLWAAIFITARLFLNISRAAAYLLIPYLLWVSFAAVLNLAIVILNF